MARLCNTPRKILIGDVLRSTTSQYLIESFSGEGSFGLVVKCKNLTAKTNVAVKIINDSKCSYQAPAEISALRKLRCLDPDKSHIVRWHEDFVSWGNTCLVFEQLDKSLEDFMEQRNWRPLSITAIRAVVQQATTALSHLRSLEFLHGDIKLPNIMLVNHEREPLKIKLIDFGLACKVSDTCQGDLFQSLPYRSPEVILGLPITPAIDMWSLGCVAAALLLGALLFEGNSEYAIMSQVIQTVGLPPNHMLSAGLKTSLLFEEQQESFAGEWKMKTMVQYYKETGVVARDLRRHRMTSLEQLLQIPHPARSITPDYVAEMSDLLMFVDLLKGMLQVDDAQRLTPQQVLEHQFVTMSHIKPFHHLSLYCQTSHNIMKGLETPGSLDAVLHSSEEVDTTPAQPENTVCPAPAPPDPAVSTGQVPLQPAGQEPRKSLKRKRKAESEEGPPKTKMRMSAEASDRPDRQCQKIPLRSRLTAGSRPACEPRSRRVFKLTRPPEDRPP